jgi:hypothetical protein
MSRVLHHHGQEHGRLLGDVIKRSQILSTGGYAEVLSGSAGPEDPSAYRRTAWTRMAGPPADYFGLPVGVTNLGERKFANKSNK